MLSVTPISYLQKPLIPTRWQSAVEGFRYHIQLNRLNPVYLVAAAIFALLIFTYTTYRSVQKEIVWQRDQATVDATSDDAKPLKRVKISNPLHNLFVRYAVDPIVHIIAPSEDAELTKQVLGTFERSMETFNFDYEQEVASGSSMRGYGFEDMPKGFKVSKAEARFPYHEEESIFNLMVGFEIPHDEEIERVEFQFPKKLEQERNKLNQELLQFRNKLLELSRFYGFLVEGAAHSSYIYIHPKHMTLKEPEHYYYYPLPDPLPIKNTAAVVFYTITIDRELYHLPKEVRDFLYSYSSKKRTLFERFLPERLNALQFSLNKVKGAPRRGPPDKKQSSQ